MQHLRKLFNTFHTDHSGKPTVISPFIDLVLLIAKSSAKFTGIKQKHGWQTDIKKTEVRTYDLGFDHKFYVIS